jgi:hypothetical protein
MVDREPQPDAGRRLSIAELFVQPDDAVERALRRVKGTYRRRVLREQIASGGPVDERLLTASIPEETKARLGAQAPQLRSGEDLPDLDPDEIELARLTLTATVHQEVTSLRARPSGSAQAFLRMVDEYEEEIELPFEQVSGEIALDEVVELFVLAEPSPVLHGTFEVSSFIFPDIDAAFDAHRTD